jgi:hypothetical protein
MVALVNPTWTRLRAAVVAGAAVETALWLGVVVYTKVHSNPAGDGLDFIAVYFSTLVFLFVTVPGLFLGLIGRWLPVGAILIGGVALLYAYVAVTSV